MRPLYLGVGNFFQGLRLGLTNWVVVRDFDADTPLDCHLHEKQNVFRYVTV